MPTRTTSSKTGAARKTTHTARKTTARSAVASEHAPAKKTTAAKTGAVKTQRSTAVAPTPAAKSRAAAEAAAAASAAAKAVETPIPRQQVESVSLIDEKPKTKPKRTEGQTAKRGILPPISRIVAPAAPPPPPKPVEPPRPAPPPPKPAAAVVDLISPHPHAPKPAPVAETPAAPPPEEAAAPVVAPEGEAEAAEPKIIHIKPPIIVKDLATQLGIKNFQLIKELMTDHNVFVNQNQTIEPDIATKVCTVHGFVFEMERREKGAGVHKVEPVIIAPPPPEPAKEEELKTRPPVITFMGHVDHGKTSLMDAIRKTRVAAGEAGGITQHIGAYTVDHGGTRITFLDTPGHAAFTAMRARGAHVTDIVVLVVAADDGLMPQTIEAINHAKAADHVKIMVALNKIDLPGANIDRVKKQLQERELTSEDWGGETIVVPVSATKGIGIDTLLENMSALAEVTDLKASPTAVPRGTVIEAQVEPGRGPTATVIVQMGTLKQGDPFICGDYWGKVKSLLDDHGKPVKAAGPSTPVRVLGFSGLPHAGDEILVMESERDAKTLSEERLLAKRSEKLAAPQRATLETLLEAADGKKHLRIVLKCDAQGSLEALSGALLQIESKKVDLEIVHAGVGPISENDILLASASNAVVIGFSIKVETMAVTAAKREGVQVKLYSIIYELIDQIKEAMAGLLDPEHRETVIGHAEVKQVFKLSRGIVAGCLVTDGRIARTARARVLRRRQPVYDGGLSTLRRFQDDVKEVRSGLECGIKLGDFNEYQVGDIIECYNLEQVAQKL